MCTMIRTFHAVGQGLFCTEQFECHRRENINIVYDCGSNKPGKGIVEQRISDTFFKGEKVHAVFISHFDDDHINGLSFLLEYCHVEKLYLPQLCANEELAFWKLCGVQQAQRGSTLLLNIMNQHSQKDAALFNERRESTRIVWVPADSDGLDEEVLSVPICYASPCRDLWDWIFLPYNYRNTQRGAIFAQAIKSALIPGLSYDDFINDASRCVSGIDSNMVSKMFADMRKAIISGLKGKKEGNINGNSLLLYSGPKWERIKKVGCWYLGDFIAKGNAWAAAYNYYYVHGCISNIGFVQLPHHGSNGSYNSQLYALQARFVASAHSSNKYHPGTKVVNAILSNGRRLICVNEAKQYRVTVK